MKRFFILLVTSFMISISTYASDVICKTNWKAPGWQWQPSSIPVSQFELIISIFGIGSDTPKINSMLEQEVTEGKDKGVHTMTNILSVQPGKDGVKLSRLKPSSTDVMIYQADGSPIISYDESAIQGFALNKSTMFTLRYNNQSIGPKTPEYANSFDTLLCTAF